MTSGIMVEAAELRVVEVELLHPFRTSAQTYTHRTVPLLTLHGGGVSGTSEGVMDPEPRYLEETLTGALQLVRGTLLPMVLGRPIRGPHEVSDVTFTPLRRNPMAKAMVEMALWDLWARQLDRPLWQLLGGIRDEVPVGVSLGIQPSVDATVEQVADHVEQGYRRIKLKIQPGWDIAVLTAVRSAFPHAHLTVDANSAYSLADAGHLRRLDDFGLDYIEQPLAFDDLVDHASLQRQLATALCLDESILTPADCRKALELGAARVINIKAARVGGLLASRRVHDVAQSFGAPVWCGGMLETGVGRAFNIHLATLPGFTKPGDTSSSSRYWRHDVIEQEFEAADGMMAVPPGPGTGVTLDRSYLDKITASVESFRV